MNNLSESIARTTTLLIRFADECHFNLVYMRPQAVIGSAERRKHGANKPRRIRHFAESKHARGVIGAEGTLVAADRCCCEVFTPEMKSQHGRKGEWKIESRERESLSVLTMCPAKNCRKPPGALSHNCKARRKNRNIILEKLKYCEKILK